MAGQKSDKKVKKALSYLPYNLEAEKAVLGSAFLSKDALFNVLSSLDEDDFYLGKHQIIYRALHNLMERKIAVDVLTVTEELINLKELENIGGVPYLQECSDSMVALSNLEFYISIVNNQSVLRSMLIAIREIDKEYLETEIEDINNFLLESEEKFKRSTEKRKISSFKTAEEVAAKVKLEIDNMKASEDNEVTGLTTGFPRLNFYTQGFQKGEMIIVAARPSVGKTALTLNFALKAATQASVPVAIFSLEMSADLLMRRLIAMRSCISLKKIATGNIVGYEREKVASAIKEVAAAPIFIDDSSDLKLMDIIAKSRKLQAAHPDLGLIIIDYLGLISTSSSARNPDSRQEEVRKISLALKGLARDLKVPVIVVSQLSRDVEKRESKKPMLSDLRDSGSIEQDADVVMLLYREDYYSNGDKDIKTKGGKLSEAQKFELARAQKEKELGAQVPGSASYVEVNVAKNRNGQTGRVPLFFYKEYGRFDPPSEEWEKAMMEVTKEDAD